MEQNIKYVPDKDRKSVGLTIRSAASAAGKKIKEFRSKHHKMYS